MEKTDNTDDDRKLVLRNIKPEVEGLDNLFCGLFPRIGSDVCVGLEQNLAE